MLYSAQILKKLFSLLRLCGVGIQHKPRHQVIKLHPLYKAIEQERLFDQVKIKLKLLKPPYSKATIKGKKLQVSILTEMVNIIE